MIIIIIIISILFARRRSKKKAQIIYSDKLRIVRTRFPITRISSNFKRNAREIKVRLKYRSLSKQ